MNISLFTKKAVYENTFIGDFPEPEPEPEPKNVIVSAPAPAKKGGSGRLRLRNTDYYIQILNNM